MNELNFNVTKADVDKAIADAKSQLEAAYASSNSDVLTGNWFTCQACKMGLSATLSGVIFTILSGAPVLGTLLQLIAVTTGIPLLVVKNIIEEFIKIGGNVDQVIEELCKKMTAC